MQPAIGMKDKIAGHMGSCRVGSDTLSQMILLKWMITQRRNMSYVKKKREFGNQ